MMTSSFRSLALAAAALTAVTATSAYAQDTTFRGVRVEGNVGYDRFQSQGTHDNSLTYGGTVGFDGQIGENVVIGAEGTLLRARGENCTPGVTGGTVCHKSFQEYGVAVRAGVLAGPALLIYGKAGFANNEQRKSFTGTGPRNAGAFYDHFNTDGYQVGGGVEYSLTPQFYVKGEYKYANYTDHTSRQSVLAGVGVRFR